jgi:hypothetical protein
MKVVQVVPRARARLFDNLIKREAAIREKGRGTFFRVGPKRQRSAKWQHRRYKGSVTLARELADGVVAKIRSASDGDWQMLSAFLGFVDRHCGDQVAAINIQYR